MSTSLNAWTRLPSAPARTTRPALYLRLLTASFTFFNSVRLIAYLPTIWAIHTSGDSGQQSLWTWCTWLFANLTMAAWLYEENGRHLNRAICINLGNAAMCAATIAVIAAYRW